MARTKEGPIRWTLAMASREYNIDRKTLEKRLTAAEQIPADDATYSSMQILAALAGDLEAEKIRKTRAEANLAELKEAKLRKEVYEAATVRAVLENFIMALRASILAQDIDHRAKQKIVAGIKEIPDSAFYSDDTDESSDDTQPA